MYAQCIHDLSLFRGPVALGPAVWPSGLPLWSAVYSESGMKSRLPRSWAERGTAHYFQVFKFSR